MKTLKERMRSSTASRTIRLLVIGVFTLAVSLLAYTGKDTPIAAFTNNPLTAL